MILELVFYFKVFFSLEIYILVCWFWFDVKSFVEIMCVDYVMMIFVEWLIIDEDLKEKLINCFLFRMMDLRWEGIVINYKNICFWFLSIEKWNNWVNSFEFLLVYFCFFWIKGNLGFGKLIFMWFILNYI